MITRRLLVVVFISLSLGGCYYVDFLRGDISYPREWPKRATHWSFSCLDLTGTYSDKADQKVYWNNTEPEKPQISTGEESLFKRFLFTTAHDPNQVDYIQISGPRDGKMRATLWKKGYNAMEKEFVLLENMTCGWGGVTLNWGGGAKGIKLKFGKNVEGGLIMETYWWDCFFPGYLMCKKEGGLFQWPRAEIKSSVPTTKSLTGP